ncbi:MAG: alpha/beta fold hydrolase, partial [Chloroflexota bacterium]|nr:alpha/beta fold hydrolase [Chloroflexota bacterium]
MKSISTSARTTRFRLPLLRTRHSPDCYVRVDGVRVRYVEAGAEHGGVPLVVVHGYNGSCDYWYPQNVLGLAERRHVIAVDLPGNGLSAKLPAHNMQTLSNFI